MFCSRYTDFIISLWISPQCTLKFFTFYNFISCFGSSQLIQKGNFLTQKWELKLDFSGNTSYPKSLGGKKLISSDLSALFELKYILQSAGWRAFKPRAFSSFGFKRLLSSNTPTYSTGMHRNVHDLHSNGCSCFLREYQILHFVCELAPSLSSSSLYFFMTYGPFTAVAMKWLNRCGFTKSLSISI